MGLCSQGSHKLFIHFQPLGKKESVMSWGSTFRVPTNLTRIMHISNTPQPTYTDNVPLLRPQRMLQRLHVRRGCHLGIDDEETISQVDVMPEHLLHLLVEGGGINADILSATVARAACFVGMRGNEQDTGGVGQLTAVTCEK